MNPSRTPHCGSCGSLSFFAGQPVHTSDCPAASPATNGESPDEWYEREKTAFRAWWESEGEKTFSRTPTLAAGAGWFARAEAAPETAPIVPCLATNGCTTPEWCARNGDACRVKTPVSETPRTEGPGTQAGREGQSLPLPPVDLLKDAAKSIRELTFGDTDEQGWWVPEQRRANKVRERIEEFLNGYAPSATRQRADILNEAALNVKEAIGRKCKCHGPASETCNWPSCVEGNRP